MPSYSLSHLSDPVLLHDLAALVAQDRVTTAALLAHLAEVDARRLYRPAAYPSMFAWCVGELGLSDDAAFRRIRAARTAREFPAIFPMLADGRLNLSAVLRLAPYLTVDTADDLLAAAAGRTDRELERLLAERFPRPNLPALVQPLAGDELAPAPVGALAGELAAPPVGNPLAQLAAPPVQDDVMQHAPGRVRPPASHPVIGPLSPGSFALQCTIGQATHDRLRYAQALLGHAVPSGDLVQVLDRALDALISKLEQRKFAPTARSCPSRRRRAADSRYVPAAVRRTVWQRDGGQCTFVSESGRRCGATARLEFDHIDPFARGGQATPAGLRLRCRAHNQFEAERTYGAGFMAHKRAESQRRAAATREAKRAHAAAEARAREDAQAQERERAAARQASADEVIPWLRGLGFRADEARRAAACCDTMVDAPIEARVRAALSRLAPGGARRRPEPRERSGHERDRRVRKPLGESSGLDTRCLSSPGSAAPPRLSEHTPHFTSALLRSPSVRGVRLPRWC